MTKNKLSDLNDHLFLQIERLSDEELTIEQLEKEIARGKAINDIAKTVIDNAKVVLDGAKLQADHVIDHVPQIIGIDKK